MPPPTPRVVPVSHTPSIHGSKLRRHTLPDPQVHQLGTPSTARIVPVA